MNERREPGGDPLEDRRRLGNNRRFSSRPVEPGIPEVIGRVNRDMQRISALDSEAEIDQSLLEATHQDQYEYDDLMASDEMKRVRNKLFWNLLVRIIPRTGFNHQDDLPMTILELAGGNAESGPVVKSYFDGKDYNGESENTDLIVVDNNHDRIAEARGNNSQSDTFIEGDATNLTEFQEIPDEVDVVIVRHQNIGFNRHVDGNPWPSIFDQGLKKLRKGGIMILTSYFDGEHEEAVSEITERILNTPYEIVINEENQDAEIVRDNGLEDDKHILVIRKKEDPN